MFEAHEDFVEPSHLKLCVVMNVWFSCIYRNFQSFEDTAGVRVIIESYFDLKIELLCWKTGWREYSSNH